MADSKFPNLFSEEEPAPAFAIGYREMSLTIQTLANLAAASALLGDMEMGKAFANATNSLIEVTMKRWPTMNPAPDFEATKQAVEAASNSSTTTEGTDEMQNENNGGEGSDTVTAGDESAEADADADSAATDSEDLNKIANGAEESTSSD